MINEQLNLQARNLIDLSQISSDDFFQILENSEVLAKVAERDIKKLPTLRGKTIINFFCEPSTRTRTSFEIAGKWLSADTINISAGASSLKKGESLNDTIHTLEALHADAVVVRHTDSGVPEQMAKILTKTAIVNAGDGAHAHPTQALLDCLALMQHYDQGIDGIKSKTIAIVGDVFHSRVARSNIYAHAFLGNKVKLVGPSTMIPVDFAERFPGDIEVCHNLTEGVDGADIVMCLRVQTERLKQHFISSLQQYTDEFFLSKQLLDANASKDYVIMHPGPVVRGIELDSNLISSEHSIIIPQVSAGVAVRMACLMRACFGKQAFGKNQSNEEYK